MAEQLPDPGRCEPAGDLRGGHGRSRQTGDPVGLRVTGKGEQVRLERVERVHAYAGSEG